MKPLPTVPASSDARAPAGGSFVSATIDHVDAEGVVHIALAPEVVVPARVATASAPVASLQPGVGVLVLIEPDRELPPVVVSTIVERVGGPATLELTAGVIDIAAGTALTLRCGEASIELRADGTIVLHGERIDSNAEGIHRIKGAQVRIN